MDNFENITVSLDDAFDCYEFTKREISKTPLHYFDFTKGKFVKIKSGMKNPGVEFVNTYELCIKVIDEYLNQPRMKEYKIAFAKAEGSRNKIVRFLWFFEHIDGCYNFEKFEITRVTKELKKWCKRNGLDYLEPEGYCAESIPLTWLDE